MSGFTQLHDGKEQQDHAYCYIFIRKDLPLPQQIVQSAHAAIEMARCGLIPSDSEHPSVIVLGIKNESQLQKTIVRLAEAGIVFQRFYEPDIGNQLTAICTGPILGQQREFFHKYQLLQAPKERAAA